MASFARILVDEAVVAVGRAPSAAQAVAITGRNNRYGSRYNNFLYRD